MTVSIDLTVAARKQVLTLPTDTVRGAATSEPWVFVVADGRLVRRNVKLGIHGEGASEIADGIDERSEVLTAELRELAEGQRVRAQRETR